MQTAVTWLLEELKKVHHPTEAMIMYAKKLEKQQIIDAANIKKEDRWFDAKLYNNCGEKYYAETYVSKGSDEEKTNSQRFDEFMQLVTSSQTTSDKWKEYQDWLNEIPEISDEEIEKAFTVGYGFQKTVYTDRIEGAKWYREQLKKKQ